MARLKELQQWSEISAIRLYSLPMERKKPKPDDPAQSKRFIDAAKEAEADETKAGADRAFKKIVPKSKKET